MASLPIFPSPIRHPADRGGGRARAAAVTVGGIGLSALAAFGAQPALGEIGGALVLVLGITLVGALAGLAAGLAAAFAAFLLYDFLLAAPVLSLRLADNRDLTPLIVFNLCAIVAGVLAGRLKDRARAADRGNRELGGLLETSRRLQSAIRPDEIAAVLGGVASDGPALRIVPIAMEDGAFTPLGTTDPPPGWESLAESVRTGSSDCRRDGRLVAVRLDGGEGQIGVLMAEFGDESEPGLPYLTALASLTALALERARLLRRVSEREAATRTEELKNALLASVSHDFRTPLTAISASASSLIDYGDRLDRGTSAGLLRGIVEECERLNRYTANLLEMSRLEADPMRGDLQTLSAADMLGAAIQRIRPRLSLRRILRAAEWSDLIVRADAALFELVLVNVFDNAIRYSPDGSRVLVSLERDAAFCRIVVADEGIGVPEGELTRIFDRFHRVVRAGATPPGSGLGLAIARGFVTALGGDIAATTPGIEGRGTRIAIRLPLAEASLAA